MSPKVSKHCLFGALTPEAMPHVRPHVYDTASVKLIGHIPYARRLIRAVRAPELNHGSPDDFRRTLWQLVTAPAPWTPAEKWRSQPISLPEDDELDGTDSIEGDFNRTNELEGEQATLEEPDDLIIWVEGSELEALPNGPAGAIGMGLRGRWGMFGSDDGNAWWAFKAKDCE
jgi:hypothetical protein